jgi:hypothetical protein
VAPNGSALRLRPKARIASTSSAMRSNLNWRILDHIVEEQLDALALAERPEDGQFGRAEVEYRQHVADADIAVVTEFVDAANRDLKRHHVAGWFQ